ASVLRRFASEPSTLTYTRACRRSGDVSTPVTVTNPIRGSFSSPSPSETTSFTASFTRRIRSLIRGIQATRRQLRGRRAVLVGSAAGAPAGGLAHRRRDGGRDACGNARYAPQQRLHGARPRRGPRRLQRGRGRRAPLRLPLEPQGRGAGRLP